MCSSDLNGALQKQKKLFTVEQIKADWAGNPPPPNQAETSSVQNDTQSSNTYEQGGYQDRSQNQTSGLVMAPHQNSQGQEQKDPNAMNVDRNQSQKPLLRCYKCHKLGHMMRDCKAPFNIRNMTYEELQDYFDQAEAVKKDREEIRTKEKAQQDFPTAAQ